MKFCSACGHPVVQKIPQGDSRLRYVCESCETIHYQNPHIICGCLPTWQDKVLLCKRGIEPRYGLWTLPAGFMENLETTQEGAARETWEEAHAKVKIGELYCVFNIPQISQVYMMYRGEIIDGQFGVGEESIEAGLFDEESIPWDDLAFASIKRTLRYFFADRKLGHFPVRVEDLVHGSRD
ncbi:NUDIX hydrolase [Agitococcus lubricus]|uniref:ADP-ribose pyrophosphatase YjhB (NUDIX family) n=1 Tax=Agitococcus lubricus TaxID=1077255 RepID=A0A2T5J2G6_9GAMM|nr:NUDIX hydrolase [Agitococcus lubricus]PTQ90709.1 ADP-ribose pyrophosphatase YjhB (NUDIX family) [Agitococcus lubricus]